MYMREDYYRILQVHYLAEPEVIEGAYKRLAKKYHPDVNKNESSVELMQKINQAYEELSNPVKRQQYNLEWQDKYKPCGSDYEHKKAYEKNEKSFLAAKSVLDEYFSGIMNNQFDFSYELISSIDKLNITKDDFINWQRAVSMVFHLTEYSSKIYGTYKNKLFNGHMFDDIVEFGVNVVEYNAVMDMVGKDDFTKMIVLEDGKWRVFVGYEKLQPLISKFKDLTSLLTAKSVISELVEMHRRGQVRSMLTITDKEFRELADYIKINYGIHLKEEKQSLITGRLHNVLAQKNFNSFSEYYKYVISDKTGEAVVTLIDKITTNHTFFMREVDHFYYFRDKVLPYLASTVREKDLRIWSAGCSSGEEPYTLAMIIDEFFGKEKMWWDSKVLATDISGKVLGEASKGIYSNEKIAALPSNWKLNYFKKLDNEKSVLIDKIRNEVIYRKLNLMDQVFPFKKKFHVIFCRNVMIYFDNKTKWELINKFYDLTEYGGYLFIGHSESLNREETKYKYIMPAVYRKE